ncbi:MAG: zinc ribbon domain-containing protein, partial [Clostridia bacterium]|nr:zinc ribbon domain-containing protein [Clostridia bacterium]
MARFCQNCGAPLSEGTKFCPNCGAGVSAPAPQPQPQRPVYGQPQQPAYQQPQQPVYQQPQQPKKKKGSAGKALIPILSVLLVVCILVTGFVYPGFFKELGRKTETVTVTEEAPAAKTESGVGVEFSPYMLEQGQSLKVKVKDAGVETAKNGDYQIKAYDITAGDLHDFGTYIRIRIPYDDSFCAPGSDPAKCVCAK